MTFPIQVDATHLTTPRFLIAGVTGWLETTSIHTLQLEPGTFSVQTPAGQDASWSFAVRADGIVDYDEARDVSQGGFLSGRGTANLALLGYSLLVDASLFPGTALELMPLGHIIDTSASSPQAISLLPHEGVTLELRTAPPKSALFELMRRNGRLALDEPYPFVEIRQQGAQPLIRLTRDTLRRKRPCRPPFARLTRISIANDGAQSNGHSSWPSLSADGRFVAFHSEATNLVPGDTNGYGDVFVHDRQTGVTTRVSVASDGSQSNGFSWWPSLSADGRFVAFHSEATNLVPGDTNGYGDVFVHDRQTGVTTRVSVASDGTQGNSSSWLSSISANGRFVAFLSWASNLVPDDTNGYCDVFVHDRQTGTTTRVSVASDGTQGNGSSQACTISSDGRFVAFYSAASNLVRDDTNGFIDIFVHDRQTGGTSRVSVASDGTQSNGDSYAPSISADGRFVTFESEAFNLVPGDTNGCRDVFVHDRQTGVTTRVSVTSNGTQSTGASGTASLSADGRFVAFRSWASNLVPGDTNAYSDIFVHDRETGVTTRVSVASDGTQGSGESRRPSVSADGRFVAFLSWASNLVPDDTNGAVDVFVAEWRGRSCDQLAAPSLTRISVASDGSQSNGFSARSSISADGRYVAFYSAATNLVLDDTNGCFDVFIHDRLMRATTRVSVASDGTQGNDKSWHPSISADGRFVAFSSLASNLVPDDTNGVQDIFVHDRLTGTTTRVSVASDGAQSNGASWFPFISADGRCVAFASEASNLVPDDTNGVQDIFVHDRLTGTTTRVSVASDGAEGNGSSQACAISSDGRFVAFDSQATNLVPGDANGRFDVFVHDRVTGTTTRVSVGSDGTQGNGDSLRPFISADGRYVAFDSTASNLVAGDTNGVQDIFVHDRVTGTTTHVSVASDGTQGNDDSVGPSLSGDGRFVAFLSWASNLVPGDTNGAVDVFVAEWRGPV